MMRRGALDFLVSVIYSVLVVIGIFLVFNAFTWFASEKQDGIDQIDKVSRVLETRSEQGTQIALQSTESIFIGFAAEERNCKEQLENLIGQSDLCSENELCVCYRFAGDDDGQQYHVCRERAMPPDTQVFVGQEEGPFDELEARCTVLQDSGLYTISFVEGDGPDVDRIEIRFRAGGSS